MVKYRYLRNERGVNTGEITNRILCFIDEHIEEELTTARVADEAGYSPFYFSRIFKNEMGITLKDYVTRRKLVKASEKIVSGYRVIDAALSMGGKHMLDLQKLLKRSLASVHLF